MNNKDMYLTIEPESGNIVNLTNISAMKSPWVLNDLVFYSLSSDVKISNINHNFTPGMLRNYYFQKNKVIRGGLTLRSKRKTRNGRSRKRN
jgi:hypothetical protein